MLKIFVLIGQLLHPENSAKEAKQLTEAALIAGVIQSDGSFVSA